MSKGLDVEALLAKHAGLIARQGPRCMLEASPHRALVEALFARNVTGTGIARVIKAEFGTQLNDETIRRHCKKECRCRP